MSLSQIKVSTWPQFDTDPKWLLVLWTLACVPKIWNINSKGKKPSTSLLSGLWTPLDSLGLLWTPSDSASTEKRMSQRSVWICQKRQGPPSQHKPTSTKTSRIKLARLETVYSSHIPATFQHPSLWPVALRSRAQGVGVLCHQAFSGPPLLVSDGAVGFRCRRVVFRCV